MNHVHEGDAVEVLDPALAELRTIMRKATGREPAPNHHGVVKQIEDDTAYVLFDDTGQLAPYPLSEVRPAPRGDVKPRRIRMSRQRPWRAESPEAVIVARPSRWGNPFAVGSQVWIVSAPGDPEAEFELLSVDSREVAAGAFYEWLTGQWSVRDLDERRAWMLAHLPDLAGRDLACWCPLGMGEGGVHQCHAEALLDLANGAQGQVGSTGASR